MVNSIVIGCILYIIDFFLKQKNTPYDVLTWTYLFLFAFMAFTAFIFLFYWIFCILRRLFVAQCDSKKTEIIGYFVKLRRHTMNGTESGCQRNLSNLDKYQNTLLSILSVGWNLLKVSLAHWQFSNSHTKNTKFTILTPDILSIEISWYIMLLLPSWEALSIVFR